MGLRREQQDEENSAMGSWEMCLKVKRSKRFEAGRCFVKSTFKVCMVRCWEEQDEKTYGTLRNEML